MVMYANEVETKEKIKITWDKKLTTIIKLKIPRFMKMLN